MPQTEEALRLFWHLKVGILSRSTKDSAVSGWPYMSNFYHPGQEMTGRDTIEIRLNSQKRLGIWLLQIPLTSGTIAAFSATNSMELQLRGYMLRCDLLKTKNERNK